MDEINRNREPYYDEYEIDLRELIIFVWHRKWFLIGLFVIAVIASFAVSKYYITPGYKTEATVQLSNIQGIYSQPATARQIIKNSGEIKKALRKNSGKEISADKLSNFIKNNISIENVEGTQIMNIIVKSNNPETVHIIAQTMVAAYRNKSQNYYDKFINNKQEYLENIEEEIQEIKEKIEKTNTHISNLENKEIASADKSIMINSQISKLDSLQEHKNDLMKQKQDIENELLGYHSFAVITPPYVPENPVSPNIKLNMAIAGVLALMLGIFVIFFKKMMTETDEED